MTPYSSVQAGSSNNVNAKNQNNYRPNRPVVEKYENYTETVRYQRRSEPIAKTSYSGPIPRIRTKQMAASNNNIDSNGHTKLEKDETPKKQRNKNYDTFDESAIETIYDEFKFLDENDVSSPSSSSARPILAAKKQQPSSRAKPSLIAYCLLALVQLIVSVAILVLSAIRANYLYRTNPQNLQDLSNPEKSVFLIDGFTTKNQALSQEASIGCFIPAILHGIAALFGFWPLTRGCRTLMQVMHIVFCIICIISWFDEIYYFSLDVNASFVQQRKINSQYVVYITILTLGYFATVILPTITLTLSSMALCKGKHLAQINMMTVSVSLGTVIISGLSLAFSVYACTKTLVEFDKWKITALPLYAYGLKEALLSLYFLLATIFVFFAFTQRLIGVQLAGFLVQILCVILLITQILTPSRLASIISNAQLLVISPELAPISFINLVVLYSSYVLLLVIFCFQLLSSANSLAMFFNKKISPPPRLSIVSPLPIMTNNEPSPSHGPLSASSRTNSTSTVHYATPRIVIPANHHERTSF